MKNKLENWEIKRELTRNIYEHEILISFNSDNDAYDFREWLENKGIILFEEWRKIYRLENGEVNYKAYKI